MNKYDYCKECKIKLRPVRQRRTEYKKCADCRGDDIKGANELRYIFKELQKNPVPKDQCELGDGSVFEDSPEAINEIEYGKVIKQSTGYVFSETPLSEIIIDKKDK